MEKYIPRTANVAPVKFMAIAAHQDDVEIMALDGIFKGQAEVASFSAVVLADGAGCPKNEKYALLSADEVMALRINEQKKASEIGRYHSLYLLKKSSAQIKAEEINIVERLKEILLENPRLEALYIHNLCDKHPTHIGAGKLALAAVLSLPLEHRPIKLFGCEVWRSLDWLDDRDKVIFNLDKNKQLADELLAVYESQNSAKRYDAGAKGRRLSNATFGESHAENDASELWIGMDLTPLIVDNAPTVNEFLKLKLLKFEKSVLECFE